MSLQGQGSGTGGYHDTTGMQGWQQQAQPQQQQQQHHPQQRAMYANNMQNGHHQPQQGSGGGPIQEIKMALEAMRNEVMSLREDVKRMEHERREDRLRQNQEWLAFVKVMKEDKDKQKNLASLAAQLGCHNTDSWGKLLHDMGAQPPQQQQQQNTNTNNNNNNNQQTPTQRNVRQQRNARGSQPPPSGSTTPASVLASTVLRTPSISVPQQQQQQQQQPQQPPQPQQAPQPQQSPNAQPTSITTRHRDWYDFDPADFRFARSDSVRDAWNEWMYGTQDKPSVVYLDSKYKNEWRRKAGPAGLCKFYNRRRLLIKEVNAYLNPDMDDGSGSRQEDVALEFIDNEAKRRKLTVRKLRDMIYAYRKENPALGNFFEQWH